MPAIGTNAAALHERLAGFIPDGYEASGVLQYSHGPGNYAAVTFQLRRKPENFLLQCVDEFVRFEGELGWGRIMTPDGDILPKLYPESAAIQFPSFQWYAISRAEQS